MNGIGPSEHDDCYLDRLPPVAGDVFRHDLMSGEWTAERVDGATVYMNNGRATISVSTRDLTASGRWGRVKGC